MQELKFENTTGVESIPSAQNPDTNQGYRWSNSSFACGKPIDFSKTFKLHLVPQLLTEATAATLEWTAK